MANVKLCGECICLGDGGYSALGCVEAGNASFNSKNYSNARGWYQRACNILDLRDPNCRSCRRELNEKIAECY